MPASLRTCDSRRTSFAGLGGRSVAVDTSTPLPAGLVFALDDEPGVERRGRRRFRYVDHGVRRCQELPGQVLFQYVSPDGAPRPVRSSEINDYLRAITGEQWTAKTFRTWSATLLATVSLASLPDPTSPCEGRRLVTAMVTDVSGKLHNTPAVCRRAYVHPGVIGHYLAGTLRDEWEGASARGSSWLQAEERRLLHLLPRLAPSGPARERRAG